MEREHLLIRLPSADLYGAGLSGAGQLSENQRNPALAASVPLPEQVFHGVSLDPSSDLRAVNLFLDDDPRPQPLIGGEVLRGELTRLRVAPFYQASWVTGVTVATTFSPPALWNNQAVVLRLWPSPPVQTQIVMPDVTQHVQRVLTSSAGGVGSNTLIFHVHVPGARVITFFAGNHNTAPNPAVASQSVTIYGARPERPQEDALATDPASSGFNAVLGTLVIPQTASAAAERVTVVDPGFTEYYFVANATTAAVLTYEVGCIVHYHSP